jgi:hypothetical protein
MKTVDYPASHREIVDKFLNGRFILHTERLFDEIKEKEEFYHSFFETSFGYQLHITQDFAYVTSDESNENLSRDISIFFAILCYELDKNGKNFLEELEYGEFRYSRIDELFENSSYGELIATNNKLKDSNARKNLFNEMSRRNIIEKESDDSFTITAAYKIFIEFAAELAKNKISSESQAT